MRKDFLSVDISVSKNTLLLKVVKAFMCKLVHLNHHNRITVFCF